METPPSRQCVDGDRSGHTLTKEECAIGQCDVACVLPSHGNAAFGNSSWGQIVKSLRMKVRTLLLVV